MKKKEEIAEDENIVDAEELLDSLNEKIEED